MITGHSPRLQWRLNPRDQARTIADTVEIAKQWGVIIPDDVAFFVDDLEAEKGRKGDTVECHEDKP
jgi:hypothetical protein